MSLLAVIPARLGATRLPRKPLRLVGGAPLVVRVWERVAGFGFVDRVVVATDDEEIAAAVRAAGGEAALTRADHPSGTDRIAEVARAPEFARFDALVNVQGDEPFVSAAVVRAATELVTGGRFPLGTVAAPASSAELASPDAVKVVTADDGRALYFSRAPIPWLREPATDDERALHASSVRRHIGVYAYAREALLRWVALPVHPLEQLERLEQLRPLAHGLAMGVAHVAHTPHAGVDTEADLARADAHWRALHDAPVRGDAVAAAARIAPHSAAVAPQPSVA